jgi:hypothetical protein
MPTATLGRRKMDDSGSAPKARQPCWHASKREVLLILRDVLVHSGQHGGWAEDFVLGLLPFSSPLWAWYKTCSHMFITRFLPCS